MSISRVVPQEVVTTPQKASDGPVPAKIDPIEVPYTSYEAEHKSPLIADYYELGAAKSEFSDEIGVIESYFKHQAETGRIDNSVSTIKSLIAKYEKMANIGKEERTVMKVAKLAEYIKFLKSTSEIDKNLEKYGGLYK